MLHEGIIRCEGSAPDDLVWEMGIEPRRGAFATFRGDTRGSVNVGTREDPPSPWLFDIATIHPGAPAG